MYQLEEKIWFWVLAVIPFIILVFLVIQIWKHKKQKAFANSATLKKLSPNQSLFKSLLKVLVLSLAFACIAFALVNPKIGTKLETVRSEGVDIVFAVDVSKSMLAEDVAPNRLDKAKQMWNVHLVTDMTTASIGVLCAQSRRHRVEHQQ